MSTVKKIDDEKNLVMAIVSDKVCNHANDPFFIKKAEEARQTLSKISLPANLKK